MLTAQGVLRESDAGAELKVKYFLLGSQRSMGGAKMPTLTPEERQRIYEEEKTRLEAREQLQAELDRERQHEAGRQAIAQEARAVGRQIAEDKKRGTWIVYAGIVLIAI